MITEAILNILLLPFTLVMELIPDFSWSLEAEMFTIVDEFFRVVCYILPMDTIVSILLLVVALNVFRIFVSLIKTIWQLMPFM